MVGDFEGGGTQDSLALSSLLSLELCLRALGLPLLLGPLQQSLWAFDSAMPFSALEMFLARCRWILGGDVGEGPGDTRIQ
jgi:hypothetical protein